jgi:fructose-1,6-bisphosphatase I
MKRHLDQQGLPGAMIRLADALTRTASAISHLFRPDNRGYLNCFNSYRERQSKADTQADALVTQALREDPHLDVFQLASEEHGKIRTIRRDASRFSVTCDPVDGGGSDQNMTVGTIFGIHGRPITDRASGRDSLLGAMCFIHGPYRSCLVSFGRGVHEYAHHHDTNEWQLTQADITLKETASLYFPGGQRSQWEPAHADLVRKLEESGRKLRYSGCLAADFNMLMLSGGGLFSYPKTKEAPGGKLRLLYEAGPLAFLIEQAGGRATDGRHAILEKVPGSNEDRTPLYIGSRLDVELAATYLQRY